MFNSPVIDLVILLSFTYFVGSLLLSTVNESIVGLLKLRQKHLKDSLENMFFEDGWQKFVKEKLIDSPHMQALFEEKNGTYPAYIPAKTFAYAIIDNLENVNFSSDKLDDITKAIKSNQTVPEPMRKVLLNIMAKTKGNIDQFQKELETFYNDSMDRAGGWYKRKIRRNMILIAILLAALLNIDTIKIGNDAMQDKNKLSKAADNIVAGMSNIKLENDTVSIKDSTGQLILEIASKLDTVYTDSVALKKPVKQIKKLQVVYAQTTGYRLGYDNSVSYWDGMCKEWTWRNLFIKIAGILMTAFALQLGAGFWFDILNKAVNLRAAGKKPEEEKK